MSSFSEGDYVLVKALKKTGTVQEVLTNTRYKVLVGSMSLICRGSELTSSNAPIPNKQHSANHKIAPYPRPQESLDLHGRTVDEAIRALDAWLDKVVLSDLSRVKVIHGLGTGRVLAAVHARLRELPAVKSFKVSEFNPGETDIYL
jgi:dsDNA-specific endonuclease/ATPase MutS2